MQWIVCSALDGERRQGLRRRGWRMADGGWRMGLRWLAAGLRPIRDPRVTIRVRIELDARIRLDRAEQFVGGEEKLVRRQHRVGAVAAQHGVARVRVAPE